MWLSPASSRDLWNSRWNSSKRWLTRDSWALNESSAKSDDRVSGSRNRGGAGQDIELGNGLLCLRARVNHTRSDDGDRLLRWSTYTFVQASINLHRFTSRDVVPSFSERLCTVRCCLVRLRTVRDGVVALSSPWYHVNATLHLSLETPCPH